MSTPSLPPAAAVSNCVALANRAPCDLVALAAALDHVVADPPMLGAIALTRSRLALVDLEDVAFLSQWRWCWKPMGARAGYAYRSTSVAERRGGAGLNVSLHSAVAERAGRDLTHEIDHANGNSLDDRGANLRPATRQEQARNAHRPRTNTSGFKGVSLMKGRWVAQIMVDKAAQHLGTFDTPVDAARAYDAEARRLFGSFARPNWPDEDQAPPPRRARAQRSASGVTGVYRHGRGWQAEICVNGKLVHLGTYPTIAAEQGYVALEQLHTEPENARLAVLYELARAESLIRRAEAIAAALPIRARVADLRQRVTGLRADLERPVAA